MIEKRGGSGGRVGVEGEECQKNVLGNAIKTLTHHTVENTYQ